MAIIKLLSLACMALLIVSCDSLNKNPDLWNDGQDTTIITPPVSYPVAPVATPGNTLKILGGTSYADSLRLTVRYTEKYNLVILKFIDTTTNTLFYSDTLGAGTLPNTDNSLLIVGKLTKGKTYKLYAWGQQAGGTYTTDTTLVTVPGSSVIDTTPLNYVTLDAVSSATRKHQITGGKAYADSVAVNFSFAYSNGVATLYLLENATQATVQSLNLTANFSPGARKTTLKNLTPGKKYDLYIGAVYGSNKPVTPHSIFTTPVN